MSVSSQNLLYTLSVTNCHLGNCKRTNSDKRLQESLRLRPGRACNSCHGWRSSITTISSASFSPRWERWSGTQLEHQLQSSRSLNFGWAVWLAATVCLPSLLRNVHPAHPLGWTDAWLQAVCWTAWWGPSETSHAHSWSSLTLFLFSQALS